MRGVALLGLAWLALAARAAAGEPEAQPCQRVAARANAALPALYGQYKSALVLLGDDVFVCPCGGRRLGGDTEQRKLGGETEQRKLGGDTEQRKVGGDVEQRKLSGDVEQRKLGGDTEQRKLGGDVEQRKLGGDVEQRKLGGDTEQRKLGGDTEQRKLGGDTEAHKLGGDTEARRLGGATEVLACRVIPSCGGFVVTAHARVQAYDGFQTVDVVNACVH